MNLNRLSEELGWILDDARTAVLATQGPDGAPSMRWVTPALLKEYPGTIHFLTWPRSRKVREILERPSVQWLFQSRSLDRIARINGTAQTVANAVLANEVLELVAPRLTTFWKVRSEQSDMVVIETRIDSAELFFPVKGTTLSFEYGKE